MKRKAYRRVQRTRQLLEAALLSLIKEKPFDTISVQEVIDRANVGRATFYAHYENKVDLLTTGFEGLEQALRERQREARSRETNPGERMFTFSHALLAHAHEHREVFPAMLGKRGGAVIQHALRNLLVQLIREEVKTTSSPGSADSIPPEAIVQFIAGGLFGLLTWWLNGKTKLSVQDANRIFRRLSIPTIKAALR